MTLPMAWFFEPTLSDNDLIFYRLILVLFSHQFWHGDWYPRWLNLANDGLGSPVFLFYGPVAFYLSASLEWLAAFDPIGTKRFILSMMAAQFAGGTLCFRWLKNHLTPQQALLAAMLYLTIPYSLHVMYAQAAIAAKWALAISFAVFLSLDSALAGRKSGWIACAVALALMMMTHLPTFITFAWIPFIYVWLHAAPGKRRVALSCLAATYVLALGMASIYLIPLFSNRDFIQADAFVEGKYSFAGNFLSDPNTLYCLPYFALCLFGWIKCRDVFDKKLQQLCYAIICITVFIILPVSLPLWYALPPLRYLQFPFRFLNMALVAFAILAAYVAVSPSRLRYGVWMVWSIGLLIHFMLLFMFSPHSPEQDIAAIPAHFFISVPEYRTQWNRDPDYESHLGQNRYHNMQDAAIIRGQGSIRQTSRSEGVWHLSIENETQASLLIRQFYFPGLQATEVSGHSIPVTPREPDGLALLELTPGSNEITIQTRPFAGERAGKIVSLLSLCLAGTGLWRIRSGGLTSARPS